MSPTDHGTETRGGNTPGREPTACRLCGCTDWAACDGGCWWVDDPAGIGPLCSSCLTDAELELLLECGRHLEVLDVVAAIGERG